MNSLIVVSAVWNSVIQISTVWNESSDKMKNCFDNDKLPDSIDYCLKLTVWLY